MPISSITLGDGSTPPPELMLQRPPGGIRPDLGANRENSADLTPVDNLPPLVPEQQKAL